MQLREVLDSSAGISSARTFCNTWVEGLTVQLPPVAVAIDDSLMALVERCVHELAPTSSNLLPSQATGPEALSSSPQRGMFPSSPDRGQFANAPGWMSSASSPMTLLEQARRAQRLNQALDNITSPNRQPGRLSGFTRSS